MKYPNITSASAGSGKTYTITEKIFDKIIKGEVAPNQIIATTFTIKAATELKGRIREKLIEEGKTKEANLMNGAIIGTINAVSLDMLKKYAFEAGISPSLQTIDENDQKVIIREFLGTVANHEFLEIADKLFQSTSGFNVSTPKYIEHIEAIISRLRGNDLNKNDLESYGEKSVEEFFALYNGPVRNHEEHCDAIIQLLNVGIEHARKVEITKPGPQGALDKLIELTKKLQNDNYKWDDFRAIAHQKLTKGYLPDDFISSLASLAGNLFNNDQFQKDYRFYIKHCFKYASQIIDQYETYKSERGLLDFTDQEAKFYDLLCNNEKVRADIRQNFMLVVVDEFQDVSPLQLSIFLKLTELVNENIWVGDPKQSIFAFRGADPKLMNTVVDTLPDKHKSQLKYSYRSRKQLVDFSNAIFSTSFEQSMKEENIVLEPAPFEHTNRIETDEENMGVAVNYVDMDYGNAKAPRYREIGRQINAIIESKKKVFDKTAQKYRPVQYRDIAILCRSNNTCNLMGSVLSQAAIPVGVSGYGLLGKSEVVLSLALMKLLAYPGDGLAKAEVLLLAKFNGDQSAMIDDRLNSEDTYKWQEENEFIKNIRKIRAEVFDFAPSKALETILSDLNLEELFASWGNLNQRISNMDALIRHAKEYQETCNRLQLASSIPGFLNWMEKLNKTNEDTMGVQSGNVVQIMTYHLSKGLEWPIVLLWDLDFPFKDSFFGVNVRSDSTVNLEDPLRNRELRLFIKPFNGISKLDAFDEIVASSPQKITAIENALEEEKRLYYVAITRARDYLYFVSNKGKYTIADQFNTDINQINNPRQSPGIYNSELKWKEQLIQANIAFPDKNISGTETKDENIQQYFNKKPGQSTYEKLKLNPSSTELVAAAKILFTHQVNSRNPIARNYKETAEFGTMIHDLICAFHSTRSKEANCQMITNYLELFGYADVVEVEWLYQAIQSFYQFLHREFDIKKIHRELPVQAITPEGNYINGIVDMVLELDNEIIIIDHKTFIHPVFIESTYRTKALSYSGQLKMYEDILTQSFNKKVTANFIYFIFEGIMMEVGEGEIKTKTKIEAKLAAVEEPIVKLGPKIAGNSFLDMLINKKDENK